MGGLCEESLGLEMSHLAAEIYEQLKTTLDFWAKRNFRD